MPTDSEGDVRRLAASLKSWSERPIGATNRRAAGITVVTVVLMMIVAGRATDPASAVRGMAIAFVGIHSVAHVVTTGMLRAMIGLGIGQAAIALASYRDPRRISGLDMAMTWVALAVVAPFFVE